jgi:hypothetical protein
MSVLLETLVTRVAAAIRLRDDLTGGGALGPVVIVADGSRPALPNRSGYFRLFDLPAGTIQVAVATAYYLPEELSVTLPRPDPLDPVVERTLLPNRLYPFPPGTTLVRGVVTSAAGDPVAGAAIQGIGRPTRSGADGRFVAYFRALSEDDVVIGPDRRRLVKAPDGTTDFVMSVSHASFHTSTVATSGIEEGRERLLAAVVLTPI